MEEDTAPPRRNDTLLLDGMRATRSSSMRFTEPQGCMEEPPVPPRCSTRSCAPPPYAPRYSKYGFIIMTEEEEKKEVALEILMTMAPILDEGVPSLSFRLEGKWFPMRETKVTDTELNWLYSALIARQPIDPSHLMTNW
jgi:hypothetical protein